MATATLTGDDLRRLLSIEERNALVAEAREKGQPNYEAYAARTAGMTIEVFRETYARARAKIEEEKVRRMLMSETVCACGEEFTPRTKGETKCPSCRLLAPGDDATGGATAPRATEMASRLRAPGGILHKPPVHDDSIDYGNGRPPNADRDRLRRDLPPRRSDGVDVDTAYAKSRGAELPGSMRDRAASRRRDVEVWLEHNGPASAIRVADALTQHSRSQIEGAMRKLSEEDKVHRTGRNVFDWRDASTKGRAAVEWAHGPESVHEGRLDAPTQVAETADAPTDPPPELERGDLVICALPGCVTEFYEGPPGDRWILCPAHREGRESFIPPENKNAEEPVTLPPPQSETPPSSSALADAARRAGRPDLAVRVEQTLGIEPADRAAWRDRYLDTLLRRIGAGHECPLHVYERVERMLAEGDTPG